MKGWCAQTRTEPHDRAGPDRRLGAADARRRRALQAQAQAQYRSAIDTVSAAETAVTQAQARYTAAIASANAAEAGIGSQRGQLTTAQGRYDESSTPFKIGAEEAQYAAAQAQVKSLDAQVRTAQDQLGYTVIRSPIDGYVGAKNIEIGATVAPGQSLLDIVPRYGTYITANYKETQLARSASAKTSISKWMLTRARRSTARSRRSPRLRKIHSASFRRKMPPATSSR